MSSEEILWVKIWLGFLCLILSLTKSNLGPFSTWEEHTSQRVRASSSEEHWHQVCDGDNIFIDNADEEALRTGGPPVAGPSRRQDLSGPLPYTDHSGITETGR